MAQKANTFEGGVEDATITTGNSGGASGDAFDAVTIGTDAAVTYDSEQKYDTMAAKVSTGATSAQAHVEHQSLGNLTDHYFRVYLYLTANLALSTAIILFENASGQSVGSVFLTSGGLLRTRDAASGTIQTMTNAIALNQWIRVEGRLINSDTVGQFELKLFNSPDSTTATETITSTADKDTGAPLGASCDRVKRGICSNGANIGPFWLDNLVAGATSYPGPAPVTAAKANALMMRGCG